jgi:deazaflavin-dependent oxidoreductase (nitroreductase family)
MADYIPPTADWVREQVELYESSGGTEATTLKDTGLPCIIVTHVGNKTGAMRKSPLMRVKVESSYVLIGSKGGSPENPGWVYNLRENKVVEIRDKTEVLKMIVREVTSDKERDILWNAGAKAYPPYNDYQAKTSRRIPVFIAEPL